MYGQQYIKFRNMCLSDTAVPSILLNVLLHAAVHTVKGLTG